MIVRTAIAMLLGLAILVPRRCAAQTPAIPSPYSTVPPGAGKALFRAVQNKDPDLWKALLESGYRFSSEAESRFYFEWSMIAPVQGNERAGNRLFRTMASCDGQSCGLCIIGQESLPIGLYSNAFHFWLPARDWCYASGGNWGFLIDGQHLLKYFDPAAAPQGKGFIVRWELQPWLDGAMQGEVPATRWLSASRTVVLQKKSGTTLYFRLRTPDDTLAYGTSLSEIAAHLQGGVFCYRAFLAGDTRAAPLRIVPGETLVAALSAQKSRPELEDWSTIDLATSQQRKAARVAWRAVSRVTSDEQKVQHEAIREAAAKALVLAETAADDDGATTDKKLLSESARELVRQFRTMTALIASESARFPDDPVMIWSDLEVRFGPDLMNLLYARAARIAEHEALDLDLRVQLLDALGDAGTPGYLGDGRAFARPSVSPYFAAILRSRWQWPCDDLHVDASLQALSECRPDSAGEHVAAETLVRLGAVSRIPAAVRDRWRQMSVAAADPAIRKQALALLTQHPAGRAFLHGEAAKLPRGDKLRGEFVHILHSRAKSVRLTERFDFGSAEECAWLLDLAP